MTQEYVEQYIMENQKYFPVEKTIILKQKLLEASDSKFIMISTIEFKDPTTLLLFSLFLGILGVDRFMLGETGIGILKVLTGGCCGILIIIDWFTVQKRTKNYNFNFLMQIL